VATPCTITARQQQRSDEASHAALNYAFAIDRNLKLGAMAARTERIMRAWVVAGRPNGKDAINRIARQVDGHTR
jgi:hypothetical protein